VAFVRQTQMGAGADEVRAYRQPQDRQGARSRRAALTAWTSRQGDRIKMTFAAVHESPLGAFRTLHDVRLESGMRSKADECTPDTLTVDARGGAIFCNGPKAIFPVQPCFQKQFASHLTQITSSSRAIPFRRRGVGHRHERWGGMRWTRQRRRARGLQGGLTPVSDRPARGRTAPKPGEAFWRRRVAAYGKAVWSWHPLLVSSWRRQVDPTGSDKTLIRRRR
jgi:hypothetical protein